MRDCSRSLSLPLQVLEYICRSRQYWRQAISQRCWLGLLWSRGGLTHIRNAWRAKLHQFAFRLHFLSRSSLFLKRSSRTKIGPKVTRIQAIQLSFGFFYSSWLVLMSRLASNMFLSLPIHLLAGSPDEVYLQLSACSSKSWTTRRVDYFTDQHFYSDFFWH